MAHQRPILLVEDSSEDAEALQRVFHKLNFTRPLHHCATVQSAWDYLAGDEGAAGAYLRPCLILLDLNLPGEDGRLFLQRLKATDNLRDLPVIVLSTSTDPTDIKFCYQHGASAYLVKPLDPEEQTRNFRVLLDYWFGAVVLPFGGT